MSSGDVTFTTSVAALTVSSKTSTLTLAATIGALTLSCAGSPALTLGGTTESLTLSTNVSSSAITLSTTGPQLILGNPVPIGTGEANTASNVGTSGVGVFVSKFGVDLRFKNIVAGDASAVVTDNPSNNTIEIKFVSQAVCNEIPAGLIDGANQIFTTAFKFTLNTEKLFVNGKRMDRMGGFCDYDVSESGGVGTGFDTITLGLIKPRIDTAMLIDYIKA